LFDTVPESWLREHADALSASTRAQLELLPAVSDYRVFRHRPTELPDLPERPPVHYVTALDGARVSLLAGPFATAAEAREWQRTVLNDLLRVGKVDLAASVDTTRMFLRSDEPARPGDLNERFGLPNS
jgi:hypothetical protein